MTPTTPISQSASEAADLIISRTTDLDELPSARQYDMRLIESIIQSAIDTARQKDAETIAELQRAIIQLKADKMKLAHEARKYR
jgi:bacterioferritin (cytochrome b1)